MESTTEHELMQAIMTAAADLVQTYNSGLTTRAIQTRMERIAQDLLDSVANHKAGDE